MKVQNKDFWEKSNIIDTMEVLHKASDFEMFMFENAKKRYQASGEIKTIKVFGCGTGRELESIAELYNPSRIVASDISENMIAKCKENLKKWHIDDITETLVIDAKDYNNVKHTFELATMLNSMMTYVPVHKDRLTIFKNILQILKPNGIVVGTVHNQVGSPSKTLYFQMRKLFAFILGKKVGNRDTGFLGFKVSGYYYDKKGLEKDLEASGFTDIEIYSLEEFYKLRGKSYNRKTGYNNIIFMAGKP